MGRGKTLLPIFFIFLLKLLEQLFEELVEGRILANYGLHDFTLGINDNLGGEA